MRVRGIVGGLALALVLSGCTPEVIGGVAGAVVSEVVAATLRGGSTALPQPQGGSGDILGGAGGANCPDTGCPNPGSTSTLPIPGLPGGLPIPGLPSTGQAPGSSAPNPSSDLAQMEQDAFAATNAFRRREGKPNFVLDPLMSSVARAHSADMGKRDYFDHDNPDGQDPFERMRAAGVSFGAGAENIYMTSGQGSAQGAIDAWDKSPGHHANMVGNYRRIGIGISRDGGNGTYFTQVFAD